MGQNGLDGRYYPPVGKRKSEEALTPGVGLKGYSAGGGSSTKRRRGFFQKVLTPNVK